MATRVATKGTTTKLAGGCGEPAPWTGGAPNRASPASGTRLRRVVRRMRKARSLAARTAKAEAAINALGADALSKPGVLVDAASVVVGPHFALDDIEGPATNDSLLAPFGGLVGRPLDSGVRCVQRHGPLGDVGIQPEHRRVRLGAIVARGTHLAEGSRLRSAALVAPRK